MLTSSTRRGWQWRQILVRLKQIVILGEDYLWSRWKFIRSTGRRQRRLLSGRLILILFLSLPLSTMLLYRSEKSPVVVGSFVPFVLWASSLLLRFPFHSSEVRTTIVDMHFETQRNATTTGL